MRHHEVRRLYNSNSYNMPTRWFSALSKIRKTTHLRNNHQTTASAMKPTPNTLLNINVTPYIQISIDSGDNNSGKQKHWIDLLKHGSGGYIFWFMNWKTFTRCFWNANESLKITHSTVKTCVSETTGMDLEGLLSVASLSALIPQPFSKKELNEK